MKFTISQRTVLLSARTPVRASLVEVVTPVPPHNHDYCEVCLVVEGAGIHLTGSERHPLGRGDIIFTVPGEVHAFEAVAGLRVINLYYLSEWLFRNAKDLGDPASVFSLFFARSLFKVPTGLPVVQFRLGPGDTDSCERELLDISQEEKRADASPAFLRAAMTKFMTIAARACPEETRDIRGAFRPEVWMAIQQIETQVAEGRAFDPVEINRGANVGVPHLARLFRKETGWTPGDYYQMRRVQRAAALILENRHSITEIAVDCGYADASHLGRNFRQYLGMTPRAYRDCYQYPQAG